MVVAVVRGQTDTRGSFGVEGQTDMEVVVVLVVRR